MKRSSLFIWLRWGLGLLLLVAAALKGHQLATEPVPGVDILSYRWSLMFQVEFEIVFGLWLLSGLTPRLTWAAALGCFAFFSGVTLYKGLTGETTCGCFGTVDVNPWYTLILDVTCVLLLLFIRPDLRSKTSAPRATLRFATVMGLALLVGVPAGISMGSYRAASLGDDGTILGEDRFVVLEPETWVGKKLPLSTHIDIGSQLAKGDWTVVLYHNDCPYCRKLIPEYRKGSAKLASGVSGRLAFVEIPPYASDDEDIILKPSDHYKLGRLADIREWFVATPTVLGLSGGKVVSVSQAEAAPGSLPDPYAGAKMASTVETGWPTEPAPGRKEPSYDLGFVDPKSLHRVDFRLHNPSGKPLHIRKVRSECKCMVVTAAPSEIAPGESGTVRMIFDAPDDSTRYAKRLILQTDRPGDPLIKLMVNAQVGLPLAVEPDVIDAGELIRGEHREVPLTVVNNGGDPVRLIYSTCGSMDCIARVPREPVPGGGRLAVPVVVKAPTDAQGERTTTLTLHTGARKQSRLGAKVTYSVSESYRVDPGAVELALVEPNKPVEALVHIDAAAPSTDGIVISAEVVAMTGAEAECTLDRAGSRTTLRLRLTPGGNEGLIDGAIRVRLADRERPLVVPVRGFVQTHEPVAEGGHP